MKDTKSRKGGLSDRNRVHRHPGPSKAFTAADSGIDYGVSEIWTLHPDLGDMKMDMISGQT
jgi:hypothetical protein